MEDGRYDPTIGVREMPVTTLQLTMFVLWKRVNSMIHPIGQYCDTKPPTICNPRALAGRTGKQTMACPSRFRKYAAVEIFMSVRNMSLKPPSSTARTACGIPKTLPLRILSAPMEILGRCGGRQCGGGGTKWSRLESCRIGQAK